jgi:acetyl-CoA carboxylase biotin carboxylase subunit
MTNSISFHKILIANRGEIAVRIMRACQELGVRSVAVYSEADANAMHVRMADEAILIGPPAPRESYLNIARIIDAARSSGAQAIHPGYGFLSENADFADAVRAAGLVFIGPSGDAMRKMGGKIEARALMQQAGVPIVPGSLPHSYTSESEYGSMKVWESTAQSIGYPLLVKAAAGGGGRGMRVVREAHELREAIEAAQREALNAFGDASVFLEKFIERAHHVEFQVIGDAQGNVLHLFERECSVQRRHQKIIEESPSPLLDDDLRTRMAEAAVAAAKAVNYENAGTIEFIVDPQTREFYFLEMNTRLQVEHPVTEWVTGVDLVQLQMRIAAGEAIPFKQANVSQRGHAIECRVYAEDAANGFLPAIGALLAAIEPVGPGVRVDSGVGSGDEVTLHYDPLIAKVIVHAADRAQTIRRMQRALAHYTILGLTTNLAFLRDVLAHPAFDRGEASTSFVDREFAAWRQDIDRATSDLALIAVVLHERENGQRTKDEGRSGSATYDPWQAGDAFRVGA